MFRNTGLKMVKFAGTAINARTCGCGSRPSGVRTFKTIQTRAGILVCRKETPCTWHPDQDRRRVCTMLSAGMYLIISTQYLLRRHGICLQCTPYNLRRQNLPCISLSYTERIQVHLAARWRAWYTSRLPILHHVATRPDLLVLLYPSPDSGSP